jgi:hypothetical protein
VCFQTCILNFPHCHIFGPKSSCHDLYNSPCIYHPTHIKSQQTKVLKFNPIRISNLTLQLAWLASYFQYNAVQCICLNWTVNLYAAELLTSRWNMLLHMQTTLLLRNSCSYFPFSSAQTAIKVYPTFFNLLITILKGSLLLYVILYRFPLCFLSTLHYLFKSRLHWSDYKS